MYKQTQPVFAESLKELSRKVFPARKEIGFVVLPDQLSQSLGLAGQSVADPLEAAVTNEQTGTTEPTDPTDPTEPTEVTCRTEFLWPTECYSQLRKSPTVTSGTATELPQWD